MFYAVSAIFQPYNGDPIIWKLHLKMCMKHTHFLITFWVFSPGTGYSSNTEFSYEDRVIKHLLRKYAERGKYGRPVKNYSDILNLHFGLQLVQIMNLDERKQILTLNVWTNYVSKIYTTLPNFCLALSLTYFGCNCSWNIVEFSIWDFQDK